MLGGLCGTGIYVIVGLRCLVKQAPGVCETSCNCFTYPRAMHIYKWLFLFTSSIYSQTCAKDFCD